MILNSTFVSSPVLPNSFPLRTHRFWWIISHFRFSTQSPRGVDSSRRVVWEVGERLKSHLSQSPTMPDSLPTVVSCRLFLKCQTHCMGDGPPHTHRHLINHRWDLDNDQWIAFDLSSSPGIVSVSACRHNGISIYIYIYIATVFIISSLEISAGVFSTD